MIYREFCRQLADIDQRDGFGGCPARGDWERLITAKPYTCILPVSNYGLARENYSDDNFMNCKAPIIITAIYV